MATNIGAAELDVVPSTRGFGSRLERQVDGQMSRTGQNVGRTLGGGIARGVGSIGGIGGIGAALGLGKIVKDSVGLEAAFSTRMAQIKANVTGATDESIAALSELAISLGKDTVFSANEAADAMLELAKGGFKQAEISGGGVQATMALAATEGLNLADAATIVSNNMNAFGIEADKASSIADALAAGSAASTASVQSLSEGLSNVGGVARGFGLDLQETTGVLAAFDQNALRGAEGGTAFRSMLTALAKPTEKSQKLLDKYGISLTDAQGNFKDITALADTFQKGLGGLSQAERARATAVIAGSYGQRALNILMKEGSKGLESYIAQTRQQGKAQELADARMTGTAGALERLSGAAETAELQIGQALAPAVSNLADYLSEDAIPAVSEFITGLQDGTGSGGEIRDVLEDIVSAGKGVAKVFNSIPGPVKKTALELGLAYFALTKLRGGFAVASAGAAGFTHAFTRQVPVAMQTFDRYTANSVAQQARLQGATTRTAVNLRGLGGALSGVAGAAGLLALTQASRQSSKEMGALQGAIGGALTGFAVSGNPFGALIGGVGGGLLGVFTSGKKAALGITAADQASKIAIEGLDGLDSMLSSVTAGYTKLARKTISQSLIAQPGAIDAMKALGLNVRTVTSAMLGVPSAQAKVDAAVANTEKAYNDAGFGVGAYGQLTSNATLEQAALLRSAGDLQRAMVLTAEKTADERREALLANLATGKLGKTLKNVPDDKVITIALEGGKKAQDDIIDLASYAKLTPRQIKILLKTAGLPATLADIDKIINKANEAARTRQMQFNAVFGIGTPGKPDKPKPGKPGKPKPSSSPTPSGPSSRVPVPTATTGRVAPMVAPSGSGLAAGDKVLVPVSLDVEGVQMTALMTAVAQDEIARATR